MKPRTPFHGIAVVVLAATFVGPTATRSAAGEYDLPSLTACRVWYAAKLKRIFGVEIPVSEQWTVGIDELGCLPVDATTFRPRTRLRTTGDTRELEVEGEVDIAPIDAAVCPCCHDRRFGAYTLLFHAVVVDRSGEVVWREHRGAAGGEKLSAAGGTFRYEMEGEYRGSGVGESLWIYATAAFPCNAGVIVLGAKRISL
ncbi:MAG: hypothetical protein KC466_01075 [Myxococcales bacterium]|nr:hypothetical protein [Myxococcales bacterium]